MERDESSRVGSGGPLAAVLSVLLGACGSGGVVWRAEPVATVLEAPTVVTLGGEGIPLVEVEIEGHTGTFAVDSGSELTMLDRAFSLSAGLELVRLRNRVTSSRGDEVVRVYEEFTHVGRLAIGAAEARDLRPLVLDLAYIEEGLDGILGMDVLGQWLVVFDDAAGELRLCPPGPLGEALAGVYAPGTAFTCLDWVADGSRPTLSLEFPGGVEFEALLDTGATGSSFPRAAVERLGLEQAGTWESRHVGGAERQPYYRLPRLAFEDVVFRDVDVDVHPGDQGLIGYALLRTCVFVVDGPNRRFCFALQPERR